MWEDRGQSWWFDEFSLFGWLDNDDNFHDLWIDGDQNFNTGGFPTFSGWTHEVNGRLDTLQRNYSTDEQPTGRTDENGNPTYETTIIGVTGAAQNTWNNVGNPIPDFGTFVSLKRGNSLNTAGSYIIHGTVTSSLAFNLTMSSTGQLQEEHVGTSLNSQPVVATIEYTKTAV